MGKSRPFSIYLLKQGYDGTNSLNEDHKLDTAVPATKLPEGAQLFVLDAPETDVWWTGYFGVNSQLKQASKGALVFLPIDQRWFVLSFGHVYHKLRDDCYEHDFGLRVTLNCVDPKKLRSTDTLQPGDARRQRTQAPIESDLTFFDFDRNSSVLRSLTGKVKQQYRSLFKDATGASSLNIKSSATPSELTKLCENLFGLYNGEDYRKTFPDIQNILPVTDPETASKLNNSLIQALQSQNQGPYLTIPDIIDFRKNSYYASFSGQGKSLLYPDVQLTTYYEYLNQNGFDIAGIALEDIHRHHLNLVDEDEKVRERYSISRCLLYETSLGAQGHTYHLTDTKWYRIENTYLQKMQTTLDPLCMDLGFPDFKHKDEGEYNIAVTKTNSAFVCMDKANISPSMQTQIEPCDIYTVANDQAVLYHVKRSTHSSQLSHLFNQGMNAIEILKVEPESVQKLLSLIDDEIADKATKEALSAPVIDQNLKVIFGIITHKDPSLKSLNFPLFSRMSLMRTARWFRVAGTICEYGFIKDSSDEKPKSKARKKRVSSLQSALIDDEAVVSA
jgi:uncharacterized protein (TIGR04141 family)